jgi:hypothetical protein
MKQRPQCSLHLMAAVESALAATSLAPTCKAPHQLSAPSGRVARASQRHGVRLVLCSISGFNKPTGCRPCPILAIISWYAEVRLDVHISCKAGLVS